MRRLLLDTHTFLWWLADDDKLGSLARSEIGKAENDVYVSAASIWEISIKRAIHKLDAPEDLENIVIQEGFQELPISLFHAEQAGLLVKHHNDPFDRMLIAQASAEGLTIVTKDPSFPAYGVRLLAADK